MPADQPTVLVVEDEAAQREVLRYNLEAEGFRVAAAGNGEEALMMMDEESPDAWSSPRGTESNRSRSRERLNVSRPSLYVRSGCPRHTQTLEPPPTLPLPPRKLRRPGSRSWEFLAY